MMKNSMFIVLLILVCHVRAQVTGDPKCCKPLLDSSSFGNWPYQSFEISDNGKYYYSIIIDESHDTSSNLTLQTTNGNLKIDIPRVNTANGIPGFSSNSQQLIFSTGNDSLCLMELSRLKKKYIPYSKSFQLVEGYGLNWLIYTKDTDNRELVLYNLNNKKEIAIPDVISYSFSPKKRILLLKKKSGLRKEGSEILEWFDLSNMSHRILYEGGPVSMYAFDKEERQLAFVSIEIDGSTIWHFQEGIDRISSLLNDSLLSHTKDRVIVNGQLTFNQDGNNLFFEVKRTNNIPRIQTGPNPLIWSYLDQKLASEHLPPPDRCWAFLDIKTKNINILNLEKEGLQVRSQFNYYLIMEKSRPLDSYYNKSASGSSYLVDLRDGTRKLLFAGYNIENYSISPGERFVIGFDIDSLNWLSYEVGTGIIKNISNKIPYAAYDEHSLKLGKTGNIAYDLAAWKANDSSVFLYDKYDIWEVDPRGNASPKDCTNGRGRSEQIVLGLINLHSEGAPQIIHANENLILSAYNPSSKESGFWRVQLDSQRDPEKGAMGPFAYYISRVGMSGSFEGITGTGTIRRLGRTGKYLVSRQSAEEYPNFYLTQDFKIYQPLTNFHPEKRYNWLTSELVNWPMKDGRWQKGILYKPENFDSTKKYPLIFTYYELRSDDLHRFLKPDYSYERINIPFYVSNGYLLFVPDIYYTPGHNGIGVLNAVESAVKYLSRFSWIDTTKLGLQGHSFGGWETNYLVTHSHIFAAACEASGVSDQISSYNELQYAGGSRQSFYELYSQGSPYGLGVTPWTHPNLYMENSPVLFADRVTTPLLIMHGDKDGAVPFPQAIEMFMSLKRAGKKVWLLQYRNADHFVLGEDAKDYTIRMKQFFDHYLKSEPPPEWMKQGIDLSGKRVELN